MASKYDEQPDLNLVSSWLKALGLTAERFSRAETLAGKTPDFRVLRGGELIAFCEVKSPNDPWLDEQLEDAPAFEIRGGARRDPTFNRLARLLNKADEQFTAVNPKREHLNILAYVNHDDASRFSDLHETLSGYIDMVGGGRLYTVTNISDGTVAASKRRIDAFLWFDDGTLRGAILNKDDPVRSDSTCELLGFDPSKIER